MADSIFYHWIWDHPLILRYCEMDHADIGEWLPHGRVYRLPFHAWHRTADQIEAEYKRARANRPNHSVHYLLNERDVCREVTARGIPATFASQNAMLDERRYTVETAEKQFDAVCNGRMTRFKRHWLGRDIPRLLVVGGINAPDDTVEYFEEVRSILPRAHFTHAQQLRAWLQPEQVSQMLNRAHVGLCLSACEGAMYAAVEYLLCGLPVVTTCSLGGRDEWFDTRYVRTVPDDPAAVAAAVQELLRLRLPPQWIRQQTLQKVCKHRRAFVEVVQQIFNRELVGRDFARDWYARFFNKMGNWRSIDPIMACVQQDCAIR
jgi:glycosyltransferase involved in cell wall biosynthesis